VNDDSWALLLGGATGLLSLTSARFPIIGWLALAPLGLALSRYSPAAVAVAAAVAGALVNGREIADRTMRVFGFLAAAISSVVWAGGFALAAWLTPPEPAWLGVALPLTVVLVHLPLRLVGAPRWHSNALGQDQSRFLAVVHTARIGGDLTPTGLLSLSGAAVAMLLSAPTVTGRTLPVAVACAVGVAGALVFGQRSFQAAVRRLQAAPTVRVSAVVANGPRPSGSVTGTLPLESPDYRDVEATLKRYLPHLNAAAAEGAELVLMPEVCVRVDRDSRQRFIDAMVAWAKAKRVAVAAPFFDASIPKNELVVIDQAGSIVARYEKQHPVAQVEGKREARMTPGPTPLRLGDRQIPVSTVICVDLDYGDLVAPVRKAGGILIVPSNDWPAFDELHHRSAVWAAVTTGVSIVRATGWGISAVFDGAGRVLARASSLDEPVVLTVDVPVAEPASD
jgi:predicted amidohydrolase